MTVWKEENKRKRGRGQPILKKRAKNRQQTLFLEPVWRMPWRAECKQGWCRRFLRWRDRDCAQTWTAASLQRPASRSGLSESRRSLQSWILDESGTRGRLQMASHLSTSSVTNIINSICRGCIKYCKILTKMKHIQWRDYLLNIFKMRRRGRWGQVVKMPAFYSNNPSLNPAEADNFFWIICVWKVRK